MAKDSAKAMAKIMLVWIFDVASGLRAIPVNAAKPINPIAIPGLKTPIATASPVANNLIVSMSIIVKFQIQNYKLQINYNT